MVSKSFKCRNRKEHKEHKDKTGIFDLHRTRTQQISRPLATENPVNTTTSLTIAPRNAPPPARIWRQAESTVPRCFAPSHLRLLPPSWDFGATSAAKLNFV